jgi:hypothetical protein
MATERKTLVLRGEADCPQRARHIDARRKALGLHRAAWPRVNGPHKRLAAGERFLFKGGE